MHFSFTDEQNQLADSVRRLLADHYGFAARRAHLAGVDPWRQQVWAQFAAHGLTALPLPQDFGGLGAGARDLLPVLREFGRALVVEPYVASTVLGAHAVLLAGTPAQAAALLPGVAEGTVRLAFAGEDLAVCEAGTRHPPRARREGSAWRLDGRCAGVAFAQAADHMIVLAEMPSGGKALFRVDGEPARQGSRSFRQFDGTSASDLLLSGVPAEYLAGADWESVRAPLTRRGIASACAEMLGVVELVHELTRDYVNTRQQFGRVLAGNQAVRHRFADMRVAFEMCQSMARLAAIVADDPASSEDADADASSAKWVMGRHGRALCESAIQLHGGIGMTDELAVGHGLRRLLVLDQSFGATDHHLRRLAGALPTSGTVPASSE